MRIGDQMIQATSTTNIAKNSRPIEESMGQAIKVDESTLKAVNIEKVTKEKLQEAVTAINDFLEVENKSSKFVLHDGLGQYYIKLVDPKTEEVIKEIPPESLLNAFYEMKKLAGMIVDEKI